MVQKYMLKCQRLNKKVKLPKTEKIMYISELYTKAFLREQEMG